MTKFGKILTSVTVGSMMMLSAASALAWTNPPTMQNLQWQNLQQQAGNNSNLNAFQLQNMFSNNAIGNGNFQNFHMVWPHGVPFQNVQAQTLQQLGGNNSNLNAFQLQNMFSNSAFGNMNHQNLHIML